MEGFGSAIKDLYQKLLLRDILSYITPGAIITLTAFYLFLYPWILSNYPQILSIHWLIYIPIFGFFFVVGFAVQCFEEWIGIINFRPLCDIANKESITHSKEGEYWNICKRSKLFLCKWTKDKDDIWWNEFNRNMQKFWKATVDKEHEGAKQGNERMVALQVMCGDNFLAIVVSGILFLTKCFAPCWLQIAVLSVLIVLFLASLFWGHRAYLLRQYSREKVIIEDAEKNNKGS